MFFNRYNFTKSGITKISALLLAILLPVSLFAQEPPKRELTEKVSEQVPIITKMIQEEKNFDGALVSLNALLSQVKPESFDTAVLSQLKAQALLNKQDFAGATVPIENALRLSESYNFFEKRGELELLWMLAQIYVQDASMEKNPDIQKQKFARALATVRKWLSKTPRPSYEAYSFAASILYQQAQPTPGTKEEPNKELLKEAEDMCLNALTTSIRPRDQIYQLLVAIAQSRNDPDTAAKYLELMVAANPKVAQNWNMLLGSYLTAAEPLPEGSFLRNDAYAKAVYTILRAQQNGFMGTPMDYQRLLLCYFNSGQHEGSIDVLENGLRQGKLENTYKNWEILAQCYLQINQIQKAIDTYKEAAKHFPTDGNIDMQIGNLYYMIEQYRPALASMKTAATKGVPPGKLPSLLFFTGYLHYELKELEEAKASVEKSLELKPDDRNAKDVLTAINEAIEERNRALKRNQPTAAGKSEDKGAAQTQNQPAK